MFVDIERKYLYNPDLELSSDNGSLTQYSTKDKANLISSETNAGCHLPVLDIDYSAELVPSTTPGHFHLYLNKPVSWAKYENVLKALSEAGLIEEGFYRNSVKRQATYVRPVGVKKTNFYRSSDQF